MHFYTVSGLATLLLSIIFISTSSSEKILRRQGQVQHHPQFPAEELLPPPALSAAFPTLRPRPPNPSNVRRPEQPQRDLIPPFQSPGNPARPAPPPPLPPSREAPKPGGSTEIPLLPPLEIPPERPLSDAEILQTLTGVKPSTSFIPTTGQGTSPPKKPAQFTLSIPPPSTNLPVVVPQRGVELNNNATLIPSNVRFPETEKAVRPPFRNCPSCECTSEVDYICASNGVFYLNSCSFDCATFCDPELRKVELEFCSSRNPNK